MSLNGEMSIATVDVMLSLKKKNKQESLEEFRDITDDVIEADFVPYACHWNQSTIVTKNGELLQVIKITGLIHEKLAGKAADFNLRSKLRDAIMQHLDSTHYGMWIHTVRSRSNLKQEGQYKRDFSGYLNHFWNDRNDWEHKFTNEVYVTIVHEGKATKISDINVLWHGALRKMNAYFMENYLDSALKELSSVTEKIIASLDLYGARRLGVVKRNGRYYSEICEFFGKLTSLSDTEFPISEVDLSSVLTDYDVTFGYNAMEVRMRADGRRRFGTVLTIREYRELEVEALDYILQVPSEFIVTQSFEFIPAKVATQGYKYQQQVFKTSKEDSLYEKTGLKGLLESDKGKKTDFGQHQINVFLLADTVKALETAVGKTVKALTRLGMTPIREDIKLEECYWAQLPGNFEFIARMRPINTARVGGFANLSNLPEGKMTGNHWGPAVTTLSTATHTPYFFNFHRGSNGHTMLVGPLDSGKTVLLNFLLSEARRFGNQLFFLDVGRTSEIFIRSLGGQYYNPYPGADPRDYAQIGFNPFSMENTPENRGFLSTWLASLAQVQVDAVLKALYERAVAQVMSAPQEQRSLGICVQYIRSENSAVADLFLPWLQGPRSVLFSGTKDMLTFDERACPSKIWGFEMGDILRHPETVVPVVSYLMHRIEGALTGAPSIIAMAEAWALLDNPYLGGSVAEFMDRLSVKNALAIFATEYVHDIQGSSINATLLKKTATQIYLPDDVADEAYGAFCLNDNEIYYLTAMNTEDRHFLVKHGSDISVVCELNISGMHDIMSVLEATPSNLAIMEEVIKTNGLVSAKWMPSFLEKI